MPRYNVRMVNIWTPFFSYSKADHERDADA